jgi:hypothetical protein
MKIIFSIPKFCICFNFSHSLQIEGEIPVEKGDARAPNEDELEGQGKP